MRCVLFRFSSCNERKLALKETENNLAAKIGGRKMHAFDWIRHAMRSPHAVFHLDFKLVQNLVGRDRGGKKFMNICIRHVARSPHAVSHLDFKLVQNLVGRDGSGREKIHAYN